MRLSFRFARVLGIDLKIHVTFLLVVLLALMQGMRPDGFHVYSAAMSMAFIVLLFVCVTLHELGHSVAALRYGISVREIVLLPIGGVAIMGRIPENPRQELVIALAGPLVNVLILGVIGPLWLIGGGAEQLAAWWNGWIVGSGHLVLSVGTQPWWFGLLSMLVFANIMLVLFNMIPAFPLDGGRVFRSLLAMRLPHARATRIAATVGQGAAFILGFWGLFGGGGITLVIIAVVIFLGAGAESAASQAGTVLATRRVGDAYNKTAIVLTIDHRVSDVIEHLMTSYQPDFAVAQRGRLVGVITREDVFRWLAETASMYDVYVTEVMRDVEQVLKVDARLTLDDVTKAMADADTRIAAVYDGELFLGLVSREDIDEAQAVLTFLNRRSVDGMPALRTPWPVPMRQVPRA